MRNVKEGILRVKFVSLRVYSMSPTHICHVEGQQLLLIYSPTKRDMNEVKYEFMCMWQWTYECKDLSFVSIFVMMDCDFY